MRGCAALQCSGCILGRQPTDWATVGDRGFCNSEGANKAPSERWSASGFVIRPPVPVRKALVSWHSYLVSFRICTCGVGGRMPSCLSGALRAWLKLPTRAAGQFDADGSMRGNAFSLVLSLQLPVYLPECGA